MSLSSRVSSLGEAASHPCRSQFSFLNAFGRPLLACASRCNAGNLTDSLCRLIASEISRKLLHPALLPTALLAIRSALFPDNALAPMRQPPTAAEVVEIKRECATTIVETIPAPIRSRYFATKDRDEMRQDVESMLELFQDPFINKNLIISAVELIVVRLFPELGDDYADE